MVKSLFLQWLNKVHLALLAGLCLLISSNAHARDEEQVKAALLYKIGPYVSWDYDPSTINYCFVGSSAHGIANVLLEKQKTGKLPGNMSITKLDSITEIKQFQCQVLYTQKSLGFDKETFAKLSQTALTIADGTSSFELGVIASIEIKKRRPKISISQQNLKLSGIRLDARLLSIIQLHP